MTQPKRVLHFQGRMGKGGAETFMMNAYRNIDRSKYQFDFVIYEEFADVRPYHDEIAALGGKIFVVRTRTSTRCAISKPSANCCRRTKSISSTTKSSSAAD